MKNKKILILFISLISKIIFAQVDNNDIVGFACFSSGDSTEKIHYFEKLLKEKKLDSIYYHLNSKNDAEKYLSTIILERMNSIEKIKLNKNQKTIIEKNYLSKRKVSICDGCDSDANIELRLLLKPNELTKEYHMFFFRKKETWLKEHI